MAKIRFHLAVIAAKLTGKLIRLLGRKGSHNPGVVALKICPNFMDLAPRAKLVVCVTGTGVSWRNPDFLPDSPGFVPTPSGRFKKTNSPHFYTE